MKNKSYSADAVIINPNRNSMAEQVIEVSVFLFLIVPSMVFSFFSVGESTVNFTLAGTSVILRNLSLVNLILFFLWRNGEPVQKIGWVSRSSSADIVLGVLLYVPFFMIIVFLEQLFHYLGLSPPSSLLPQFLEIHGSSQLLLAVALVTVVAITEETIFRGYLIMRFNAITGSPLAALLMSTVVFSIGHGYEGALGVVSVAAMGLIFGALYLWRGNLVIPIVLHFVQDFISIILVPLLIKK